MAGQRENKPGKGRLSWLVEQSLRSIGSCPKAQPDLHKHPYGNAACGGELRKQQRRLVDRLEAAKKKQSAAQASPKRTFPFREGKELG